MWLITINHWTGLDPEVELWPLTESWFLFIYLFQFYSFKGNYLKALWPWNYLWFNTHLNPVKLLTSPITHSRLAWSEKGRERKQEEAISDTPSVYFHFIRGSGYHSSSAISLLVYGGKPEMRCLSQPGRSVFIFSHVHFFFQTRPTLQSLYWEATAEENVERQARTKRTNSYYIT